MNPSAAPTIKSLEGRTEWLGRPDSGEIRYNVEYCIKGLTLRAQVERPEIRNVVAVGLFPVYSKELNLRRTLRSYSQLPANWDGEGAEPPPRAAVYDAIEFLENRPDNVPLPLPEVASIGDVGIYWDEDSVFAEVQFGGDRTYSYYAKRRKGRELVEEYSEDGIALSSDGPTHWADDLLRLLYQIDRS